MHVTFKLCFKYVTAFIFHNIGSLNLHLYYLCKTMMEDICIAK